MGTGFTAWHQNCIYIQCCEIYFHNIIWYLVGDKQYIHYTGVHHTTTLLLHLLKKAQDQEVTLRILQQFKKIFQPWTLVVGKESSFPVMIQCQLWTILLQDSCLLIYEAIKSLYLYYASCPKIRHPILGGGERLTKWHLLILSLLALPSDK